MRSQDHSRSHVYMSKQLNGCANNNTPAENRKDTKTTDTRCATESMRLTQATVFHNLCRDHHEITAESEKMGSKNGERKFSKVELFLSEQRGNKKGTLEKVCGELRREKGEEGRNVFKEGSEKRGR